MKDGDGTFVYYPKLTGIADAFIEEWTLLKWDRIDANVTRMRKQLIQLFLQMRNKVLVSELLLDEERLELVGDAPSIFF